jgi:hypothetical protein
MQIDESNEHWQNADLSRHSSLQPDSNVTVDSDGHFEKHSPESFSREEGMQIDESDEHCENVESSMHESLELGSKVTVEREVHEKKQ